METNNLFLFHLHLNERSPSALAYRARNTLQYLRNTLNLPLFENPTYIPIIIWIYPHYQRLIPETTAAFASFDNLEHDDPVTPSPLPDVENLSSYDSLSLIQQIHPFRLVIRTSNPCPDLQLAPYTHTIIDCVAIRDHLNLWVRFCLECKDPVFINTPRSLLYHHCKLIRNILLLYHAKFSHISRFTKSKDLMQCLLAMLTNV